MDGRGAAKETNRNAHLHSTGRAITHGSPRQKRAASPSLDACSMVWDAVRHASLASKPSGSDRPGLAGSRGVRFDGTQKHGPLQIYAGGEELTVK